MTLLAAARSAGRARIGPERAASNEGASLFWLLAAYPLWWALGLGVLAIPFVAAVAAVKLVRRRSIAVPPAFGWWLLFLLAVTLSLANLGVDPPGTIPETWFSSLPGATFRFGFYCCCTLIALWAYNLLVEGRLRRERLIRLLAWLFVVTVAGGLLGTFAGSFEYTSPVEALLPKAVAKDGFVQSLVHPAAAQTMDFLGYETPRPAAPWGYTNTWGNNFAITAVWLVVAAFCIPAAAKWRVGAVALLVVSLVPAVYSMNRGLWLGLAAIAVFTALRLLISGRPGAMLALGGAGCAAILLVVLTPLGTVVQARMDNGHSDEGRAFSSERATELVVEHSPVIGFGSTRKTLGSGESIAVGPTPECPRCGGRTLGGNGQLWQVMFAHGIAGTVAYLGFALAVLWRFRRDHTAIGIAGSAVVGFSLLSMFYYNALVTPLLLTLLSYVLLAANNTVHARGAVDSPSPEPGNLGPETENR
ncbi:hypothetical protein [Glycomyces harbinensis]|uniref:O-antigen ligase like membrane protein n=1 Tax=Glycomyces harbinensis TaxID=58114 RepID=A0A1G6TXV6_9ACTN|nr:hypothetical protein [Glycomyces harbinensis]SDD33891.1 hypothetical protein SAMN05216270_103215 [Glycomyces harbinensis]